MLAVMDIGNTHVVLGVYEGSCLKCRLRFRTEHHLTSDELGHLITSLLSRHVIFAEQIEAVCISSVVPELDRAMDEACKVYLGREALWVGRQLQTSMPLLIDHPQELGADRVVNSYAAWKKFHTSLIVVDLGTATTLDVISGIGEYVGGAIVPGIKISSEALFGAASKLSPVTLESPHRVIGKNTKEQIQIGLILGHAALIDGLVERMQEELAGPCYVIATGGLAPFMKQASKTIQIIEPDLMLFGLCLLYQEYKSGTRDSFIFDRPQCVVGHQEAAC
jgi:type III pantothenate kinase